MQELTIGVLKAILNKYPDSLPVIIGDDEELNGVHLAFYCEAYDFKQPITDEETEYIHKSLNMDKYNNQKVLLIS